MGFAAAEMKCAVGRITNGPAAHAAVDRAHGGETSVFEREWLFLRYRNDVLAERGRARSRCCRRTWPAYLSRTGPTGQSQTMDLADDGVAADITQGVCNLAGGQTCLPKGFQSFDTIIGPMSHEIVSTTGGRKPFSRPPTRRGRRAALSLRVFCWDRSHRGVSPRQGRAPVRGETQHGARAEPTARPAERATPITAYRYHIEK